MKTAGSWNVTSRVGKVMVALVLTTMLGAAGVLPAHSEDHDRRIERHDNGRYEERGRWEDRGRRDHGRYNRDRRYYRAPVYRERVYVEPQVIYAPPRPSGISIFLPPLIFGN